MSVWDTEAESQRKKRRYSPETEPHCVNWSVKKKESQRVPALGVTDTGAGCVVSLD